MTPLSNYDEILGVTDMDGILVVDKSEYLLTAAPTLVIDNYPAVVRGTHTTRIRGTYDVVAMTSRPSPTPQGGI